MSAGRPVRRRIPRPHVAALRSPGAPPRRPRRSPPCLRRRPPPSSRPAEPVPPIAPVLTRDVPDEPEVRVLGQDDSLPELGGRAHEASRRSTGTCGSGDALRALITGPRNDLERRVLSEGTDSAGGFTVPDILIGAVDRPAAERADRRPGRRRDGAAQLSDVTKIARLLTDPTAAWRAENAAVAESDPVLEAVTFAPKSLDVFFKTSPRAPRGQHQRGRDPRGHAGPQRSPSRWTASVCRGSGTPPQPRGLRTTTGVNEVSMGAAGARDHARTTRSSICSRCSGRAT